MFGAINRHKVTSGTAAPAWAGLGWAARVFCSPIQPWLFVWNVTKPRTALSVAVLQQIWEIISLGVGGTEHGRAQGWPCCCPGDTQASLPAVRRVVQSCFVEGFIHLLSGCADKSPVITGNKAIMTICFNISANTPFYETFFPFLFCRLKGTAWKDAFHFSLCKHTAYGRYLSHLRMGFAWTQLSLEAPLQRWVLIKTIMEKGWLFQPMPSMCWQNVNATVTFNIRQGLVCYNQYYNQYAASIVLQAWLIWGDIQQEEKQHGGLLAAAQAVQVIAQFPFWDGELCRRNW